MEYERNGIGTDDRVPFVLDLMDKKEKNRRLRMWDAFATIGQDKLYNGLDTKYTFRNKMKKLTEVQNHGNEINHSGNN